MRILVGIDSLGVGGKERQAVALVKGLASRPDVDCLVICFDDAEFYLDECVRSGVPVNLAPRRTRWDMELLGKVNQLAGSFDPQLVHTNGLVSTFYCLPFAKRRRVPLINGSIRNAFAQGGVRWSLEKLLLRFSDYRVANSQAGLRSRNLSANDPKNCVIYNGFDFERIDGLNHGDSAEAPVQNATRVVGMVAEFNRYKDYRTFIEAARIVSHTRGDVVFQAVGDGATLEACVAAASGMRAMQFLGQRRDVERVVRGFDVGVLSSFGEGVPNCVMEYMALAKAVVASDSGGTRELVLDGVTGMLVKPRDRVSLAAAIEYLLDHPSRAREMGIAGQMRLREDWSLVRMIEATVELYRRAIFKAKP